MSGYRVKPSLAWKRKFNNLPAKPPRSRFDKHYGCSNDVWYRGKFLAPFKSSPTFFVTSGTYRPFLGRCCNTCLALSRNNFFDQSFTSNMVLKNIFHVDTVKKSSGWLTRRMGYIICCAQRNCNHKYSDVHTEVMNNPSVLEAIEYAAEEDQDEREEKLEHSNSLKIQRNRAIKVFCTMKAAISTTLIRITGWVLLHVLGRMLGSIQVHPGQLEMVQRASRSKIPLVFLPLHRSHLDYILLTFILFFYDIRAPHVAAGDNLNIPFFRYLLKGLGGFFIKRKLDQTCGKKDVMYRAVLQTYMEMLLKRGEYLEFFIEGGRSRSGKAILPKAGLLSVVVDAYTKGLVSDVYLVPVSIGYEKVLDGEFVHEHMGKKKVPESFWGAVRAIYQVLRTNYGHVRVTFCQPFSLQEFVQSTQIIPAFRESLPISPDLTNGYRNGRSLACNGGLRKNPTTDSMSSLYGTDVVIEEQRHLVACLATHVLHTSVSGTPIMSTNLLALLLLVKYRKGVELAELVNSFNWLRKEVLFRERDVGFSGHSSAVIQHALDVCYDKVLVDPQPEGKSYADSCFLIPKTSLPDVFHLTYYSSTASAVFVNESIVVTAIKALYRMQNKDKEQISIPRQALVSAACDICSMLQYEFIFAPPCTTLQSAISDAVDALVSAELLTIKQPDNSGMYTTKEEAWARNLAASLSWNNDYDDDNDDDDTSFADEQITVNYNDGNNEKLEFLWMLLQPLIQSYYVAAKSLYVLLDSCMEENQFIQHVYTSAMEHVNSGLTEYTESVSVDTFKNCLNMFEKCNITHHYYVDSIHLIELMPAYNCEESLVELISKCNLLKCSS